MTRFRRVPEHAYQDPLSQIWLTCAQRIGFTIRRSVESYASVLEDGTILIGNQELLDMDDCLAQMIFHELCHGLVEGEAGRGRVDWGLDNTSGRDTWREHACLRLQAYLAESVGLRDFFAPTTDFRVTFWNRLNADPLLAPEDIGGRREPSCIAARLGAWRSTRPPWAPHLRNALEASADVAAAVSKFAPSSQVGESQEKSLWSTVVQPPIGHPLGHSTSPTYVADKRCRDCAWSFVSRQVMHCRHEPKLRLSEDAVACARWEAAVELDCQTCGACCREAYQAVEIGRGEAIVKLHPELIDTQSAQLKLRRHGERCAALRGGVRLDEKFACEVYSDRPRTCRDFTLGSENCLDARRRVGLSL